MQADGQRLLELAHVQADAQLPCRHVLEGDFGLVEAFRFAQQAVFRALASLGQNPVIDAVDGRVGHQRVLHQVAQQHVETEDVVGHQQFGSRGGRLGRQALAQGISLFMHGFLELQAHHNGIDHQCQGDQEDVMAGDPQRQRYSALAQGTKDQQEEVVGFYRRRPVHRARLFMSVKLLRSIASSYRAAKYRRCPIVSESR